MSAYCPPLEGRDPKRFLLLDFNERTQSVSQAVENALVEYIRSGRLQMYPAYGNVVERIATYANVPAEQVMITNGSDQGIDLVIRSACDKGDEIIIPSPSFAMYEQCAQIEQARIISPPYLREAGFPLSSVLAAISERTRVIVVSNPNNPTGTACSRQDIVTLAKAAPDAVILVDECYFEYCGITVCDLVERHPNIVVVRTFSKTWGIPSLRLGYVIAAKDNILALLNVRGPYDINQLAVVAIQAALDDLNSVASYVREVMEDAKPAFEAFLDQHAICYWPSQANFIWIFPPQAETIDLALQQEGIRVRPKKDRDNRLGLRITLGTLAETKRCMDVIEAELAKVSSDSLV